MKEKREKAMLIRLTAKEHEAIKKKASELKCTGSELIRLTFKTICYV